jgi:hypothetical protein
MPGTFCDQMVFGYLLRTRCPRIHKRIQEVDVEIPFVTVSWFMCLFVNSLRPEVAMRVWDVFLCEGCVSLFRVGLSLFKMHEPEFMGITEAPDLFLLLKRMGADVVDPEVLIKATFPKYSPTYRPAHIRSTPFNRRVSKDLQGLGLAHLGPVRYFNAGAPLLSAAAYVTTGKQKASPAATAAATTASATDITTETAAAAKEKATGTNAGADAPLPPAESRQSTTMTSSSTPPLLMQERYRVGSARLTMRPMPGLLNLAKAQTEEEARDWATQEEILQREESQVRNRMAATIRERETIVRTSVTFNSAEEERAGTFLRSKREVLTYEASRRESNAQSFVSRRNSTVAVYPMVPMTDKSQFLEPKVPALGHIIPSRYNEFTQDEIDDWRSIYRYVQFALLGKDTKPWFAPLSFPILVACFSLFFDTNSPEQS